MEAAAAVRKFSVRSITTTTAVVLALIASGLGGYWLKSQADSPSSVLKPAAPPVVSSARQAASALESSYAASQIRHAQAERAEAGQ